MQPVADHLGRLLNREVPVLENWENGIELVPGDVAILENVRFNVGEKMTMII
jgi:phosphoglycerate kinase